MAAWLGPAIIAAVISGLVSLILVQLNFRTTMRADRRRHSERIRDFQIALRAEIRSELRNLERFDLDDLLVARHLVFDAIVSEIHVLPEAVIDPVVLYVRQRQVVESLSEDMRDPAFKSLSRDRQLAMYRDYLEVWRAWKDFAKDAERPLTVGALNSSGAGRSGP